MQIRDRRTTWALLRTKYDPVRKRGVTVSLGSVPKTAEALPGWAVELLAPSEREQIETVIRKARTARDIARQEHYARVLPSAIAYATEWYLDPRADRTNLVALASDTREEFSRLLAAMVKAGVGRKRKRIPGRRRG